ncbi:MAG: hypothetical protein JKY27_00605 [Magnetovibrio sp.]|nr:hypothetical protein [Magnetovibrio sp.]
MDSRRVIAAQNRNNARTLRLEQVSNTAHQSEVDTIMVDRRSQILLPIFTLILFSILGSYWYIFGSPLQFFTFQSRNTMSVAPQNDRYVNANFNLDGVQLGMTPDMMLRLHPTAKRTHDSSGNRVITLNTSRGMLVAWLHTEKKYTQTNGELLMSIPERIYRLRTDEAFTKLSEQDLMRKYGRTYGRPLETACERNQLGDSPRCTYRWWGGDGIELTVSMKQKTDANGKGYVLLTTIATSMQNYGP